VIQKTNFGLVFALHRTLITQPWAGRMELLRDCLLALPNLHTLGIIDDGSNNHAEIRTVFMKFEFPNIKRAAIPILAGPILLRLPNLEELTCYCEYVRRSSFRYIRKSSWRPHVGKRHAEPVLKSLSIIGPCSEENFIGGMYNIHAPLPVTLVWILELIPSVHAALVQRFPRIRKVCLPRVNYLSHHHLCY